MIFGILWLNLSSLSLISSPAPLYSFFRMARMFGTFTHPMFFTNEERFALTFAGDRIEHPFEFLLFPGHVPAMIPETRTHVVQQFVSRGVSVHYCLEAGFTMVHECELNQCVIPFQHWQFILPKLATKCGAIFPSHCTTHVFVELGKLLFFRHSHETPTCPYLPFFSSSSDIAL
jgi:hypothetical protein